MKPTCLLNPTEVSLEEYKDIIQQIENELQIEDCRIELRDASRYNDIDVARAVLYCHQSIINDIDEKTGNTALHMAAANGHVEVVQLLLDCGADPKLANNQGNTPLHWAASNAQQKVVDILLKQQSVDVLQQNKAGRSALTEGFSSENTDVIQSLLEHESATEEKLIQNPGNAPDFIIHDFVFNGTKVRIRELAIAKDDRDSILGQANPSDDTTGFGIWASSLVCAQWMAKLKGKFEGKRVLELGAGCGVPGLTIGATNTCQELLLTDFNPKTVENLAFNVGLNTSASAAARMINWQDQSTWPQEKLDFLIGADLIYQSDMVPLLVSTIKGLLAVDGRFLYVAPDTGRQGLDDLFVALSDKFRVVSEEKASSELMTNPLESQDDDMCFLHFHELQSSEFILYEFAWK